MIYALCETRFARFGAAAFLDKMRLGDDLISAFRRGSLNSLTPRVRDRGYASVVVRFSFPST